ncbi:MAG: DUF3566 domain-containing protein [Acidimicrobiia bacterium]|nr:MAG: DUF3566 domain-containing protein [Acidimicrobiia bacterium]
MAVQRVRRVIRRIDPWTVLKVSAVFNALMALAVVLGMVIFWAIFVNAGIPDKINDLAMQVGLVDGITLDGATYFRIVLVLAVVGTILLTGLFTLGAVIYNLITDLVGGIEVVMLEETTGTSVSRPRVTLPSGSRTTAAPKRGAIPTPRPALVMDPVDPPVAPEVERTA